MNTLQRVQHWASLSIPMDITTAILRSEGVSDEEISSAYTAALSKGYELEVEKGMPVIVL